MAIFMWGNSLMDWPQMSLILLIAFSLIIGEELVLYGILVLVDWAP